MPGSTAMWRRSARPTTAMQAETLITTQANLVQIGSDVAVEELVADKGYHDNRLLAQCATRRVRTYIPERKQKVRRWTDKPGDYEAAFRANRRRVCGEKGKRLQRRRSEQCERPRAAAPSPTSARPGAGDGAG